MAWRRGRTIFAILWIVTMQAMTSSVAGQGLSRSHGAGMRIGFWKMNSSASLLHVSKDVVEIRGIGPWFYVYSRLADEWMVQLDFGMIGNFELKNVDGTFERNNETESAVVIPLLFGLRYDFLSLRNPGMIQPYLSGGIGPHWITQVDADPLDPQVDSGAMFGGYLGAGFNIAFLDWIGLNFDLKYHMVDFKTNHDFSGFDFGIGFTFMWGKKREMIRVQEIRLLVTDIYPAYYQYYNRFPIAMVSIRNLTGGAVDVNIRSSIQPFSERPRDTGFVRIDKNATKDIPINALFGPRIRNSINRETAVLDLLIEARAGGVYEQEFSTPIFVHNRNAWNGEMDKLIWFVTSDDERILSLSRSLVRQLDFTGEGKLRNFYSAAHLFDALNELGLRYHSDPLIPFYRDDRVQYAYETLELKSGDCDDLVVLYASLLGSVGIHSAFIEVRDPDEELAHVYLIFNSGISAEDAHLISSNDKRYVLRENSIGQTTVWIPVETTILEQGFEEAWKSGALQYLQDGILAGGISEDWVRIIDVD